MKALLAVLMLAALPVAAQLRTLPPMPEEYIPPPGKARCLLEQGVCTVHMDEYFEMRSRAFAVDAQEAETLRIKAELEKLRTIKGCGKLEVTEPPKREIPPLKKEIDG